MPWNSISPNGALSVGSNRPKQQENTSYIEVTMGNSVVGTNTNITRDHFWNVGSSQDGRHRFINSLAFTVGGLPTDPVIGTGMDGVLYLKKPNANISQIEWFRRNVDGIYQVSPSFVTGNVIISSSSSLISMITVPDDSYGEIFMYSTNSDTDKYSTQSAIFKARGGICQSYALTYQVQGSGTAGNALYFGNGSDASGLNIRVRRRDSSLTNWVYKVTYRAL